MDQDDTKGSVKTLLAALFFLAICAFMTYSHLPGLWTDMRTSDWRPAVGLKLENAKCKRYYFVMSTCSVTYSNPAKSEQLRKTLDYLTLGGWGGETAMLVQSASNPERVSLLIATNALVGRTFALMAFAVLPLVFVCIAFARRMAGSEEGDDRGLGRLDERAMEVAATQARVVETPRPMAGSPANAAPSFGRRKAPVR